MRISNLFIPILLLTVFSCGGGGSYSNGPIESATTRQEARRLISGFEREIHTFMRVAEKALDHPEHYEKYGSELEEINQRLGEYKEKIEEASSNGLISDEERAELELEIALVANEMLERFPNTTMGTIMGLGE